MRDLKSLQTHPIGNLPLQNEITKDVIGRQPWVDLSSRGEFLSAVKCILFCILS
jgi:hypothetical protein